MVLMDVSTENKVASLGAGDKKKGFLLHSLKEHSAVSFIREAVAFSYYHRWNHIIHARFLGYLMGRSALRGMAGLRVQSGKMDTNKVAG